MALTNYNAQVAWTQQLVNTAINGRLHIGAILPSATATTGLTVWRNGVVCTTNQGGTSNIPNDLQVKAVSPTPSLSLTVEAGHCVITRSGQGPYLCVNSAQGTLTLAAADTVNPRIDIIVAQLYDTALGDSMPSTPALAAPGGLVVRPVTGTPAGSPVAPSVPTGAILLANIAVAANATQITSGNITDLRRSAFTASGPRTQLPGDVAVTDNGAVAGEAKYTVSSQIQYVWTGTVWQPVGLPVYATTATRNTDLGAGGQIQGQQAYVAGTDFITTAFGGAWYNTYPGRSAPVAQLFQGSAQTLSTGSFTDITFDSESLDNYNGHSTSVNTNRYTAQIAGLYLVSGAVAFATNATGLRATQIVKNGVSVLDGSDYGELAISGAVTRCMVRPTYVTLNIGDYITIQGVQFSGGNLNTFAANPAQSSMSIAWQAGI